MKLGLKRWIQSGTALTCICVLALTCLPAGATDVTSLENTTSDLESQLTGINSELLALSEEIESIQRQVEMTNGALGRTQEELAMARMDEASQYEDMKTRIKYMYEEGHTSLLEMLLSAESLVDFLNKAEFIQNISTYDREMLTKLESTRSEIESAEQVLEAEQESLAELQRQVSARQAELQQKATDTSANLAAVQAELEKKKAEEAARLQAEAEAQKLVATQGSVAQTGTTMSVDASELDIFAAILECEAYHEYNSMLAVATVIMNRVNSPSFPNTIREVVYAPGQFQPTWSPVMAKKLAEGPTELGYQVAQDALNGARLAEVSDCFYFLGSFATTSPGIDVGGNIFYQTWPTD